METPLAPAAPDTVIIDIAMVIAGVDPAPATLPRLRAWARDYWHALLPHSAGGGYVNFMEDEGDERVQATYRQNHARLVDIKTKYDPDNVFHVNWNIRPRTNGRKRATRPSARA